MVIKPMIRNNICMNAHPEGARALVNEQIDYVRQRKPIDGPKRVLVIGGSTGYGLATRIAATYGSGAGTINVAYESPAKGSRTATIGWYNTHAFEERARGDGYVAESLFGDAFSHEMKQNTIDRIKELFGSVDLVVYSLASGVRVDPDTGERYTSVLKPVGSSYESKSIDTKQGEIKDVRVEPATEEEIERTVKVMGGEDWQLWIHRLMEAGVLAEGAKTVAYSYIGPDLTRPLYRDGTIGRAKEHLEATADELSSKLSSIGGEAFISVNKAIVTRASSVIPVVSLYLAILYRVMKRKGLHEDAIEQMYRLLKERLYDGDEVPTDEEGRIRLDDWEMREDIQEEVSRLWEEVDGENVEELADVEGLQSDFLHIHGFGFDSVDYEKDVEP
jgi:enoyl-[acyl-carrier protein] reductase/trans-2-enoyl-CoA reductase (NAD+)